MFTNVKGLLEAVEDGAVITVDADSGTIVL